MRTSPDKILAPYWKLSKVWYRAKINPLRTSLNIGIWFRHETGSVFIIIPYLELIKAIVNMIVLYYKKMSFDLNLPFNRLTGCSALLWIVKLMKSWYVSTSYNRFLNCQIYKLKFSRIYIFSWLLQGCLTTSNGLKCVSEGSFRAKQVIIKHTLLREVGW